MLIDMFGVFEMQDRTCPRCNRHVEKGDGIFYLGNLYHRDCFALWYGRKFGFDKFND
jgi:hypothetical protein